MKSKLLFKIGQSIYDAAEKKLYRCESVKSDDNLKCERCIMNERALIHLGFYPIFCDDIRCREEERGYMENIVIKELTSKV